MQHRTQLIGLDKPRSAPLASVANPLLALKLQASAHERNRLDSIAEIFALIALLTVKKVLTGREVVGVRGAVFQFGSGVRKERTVAAHCLPGQVQFNGQLIHTDPIWTDAVLRERGLKPLAMSSKLRNICARTDAVDALVNDIDSLVEKMSKGRGLKILFGRALARLLEKLVFQPPRQWAELNDLLRETIDHYRLGAGFACEERFDFLDQPTGVLRTKNSATAAEETDLKKAILIEYRAVLRDQAFMPPSLTQTGFRWLIKDVIADETQLFP